MKLFCITHNNIYGEPEVLMDETGCPEVYLTEANASRKCEEYQEMTGGGYYVEEFETEDGYRDPCGQPRGHGG